MKNKFSLVLLVLLISFCSSSSNDNTDTIKLNNLNLKPLIEADKNIYNFIKKYPTSDYSIDLKFKKDLIKWKEYDFVVINDNLKKCYNEIIYAIKNKRKKLFDRNLIQQHVKTLLN